MAANDKIIEHYASSYQHWDLVLDTGMGYLDGCATKYVARWRKKGGFSDLEKAIHYVDKLIEWIAGGGEPVVKDLTRAEMAQRVASVTRFSVANAVPPTETLILIRLATRSGANDLYDARALILYLMKLEPVAGVAVGGEGIAVIRPPLKDPDPVPLTEENHYAERAQAPDQEQDDDT